MSGRTENFDHTLHESKDRPWLGHARQDKARNCVSILIVSSRGSLIWMVALQNQNVREIAAMIINERVRLGVPHSSHNTLQTESYPSRKVPT